MELSRKGLAIADSLTLAIDAKAKAMAAQGLQIVGFGAGEPDFDTPLFIREAAKKAMDEGKTRYTAASGTPSLRQAIVNKLKKDNGLDYTIGQIVVSNGAKHSLANAFQAILNPGDEVIIPVPYWVSYPELVKIADGTPIFVEGFEENGFRMKIEDIEKAITPKTKALVLCNPSNPSGAMYNDDELRAIAALAVKHDFFIVSDEIYERLVYDGRKFMSVASISEDVKERTIVINGASKAYAMTGWRIGYSASTPAVAKIMSNLQSQATSNPNTIAQYAVEAALTGPDEEIQAMVAEFEKRRNLLYEGINTIPGLSCRLPEGAFYIMVNIKGILGKSYQGQVIKDSMDTASLLLEQAHVALVPGLAFGVEGFLRLSYATSQEMIREGVARIKKFVGELED